MSGTINSKRLFNAIVIFLNIILVAGLAVEFFIYDSSYKAKLYNQNVDDISNVNQASANIAATFFSGREAKLRDIGLHIEHNGLDLEESMDYILSTNSDVSKSFELVGEDLKGYCIEKDENGLYYPVSYAVGYSDLSKLLKESRNFSTSQTVGFAPEFTDAYTALRSFALYNCITIRDENGEEKRYTLMVVSKSAEFINMININSGYESLSTTIINEKGDYIIGNSNLKSDNFFKFLAVFNKLTLDQRNDIRKNVLETSKGSLEYHDARNRDSVFVYTPVAEKDWFCVSAVPVDDFHNSSGEFSFAFTVACLMLMLLTLDMCYLALLNRKLKISAENERIASVAKTEFLSRMSHDMRTPMNGIIGMTRLTQDIPNLPDEVQENLSAISDSGAYLLQLINDTLDMSKIESRKFTLNPAPVNSGKLIEHIISSIKPLSDQKNINLEFVPINADLGFVLADKMRVQQIFMNILSNAVKFTPENGTIRIEVECLNRDNGVACDRISVTDSGCGMSEEFLKHIYEPFSQESTRIVRGQEGTGLGMAIVKNLVELMGGRVEIQSQLGKGTTVSVFINFERVYDVEDDGSAADASDEAKLSGKRVLIAEDHPLNATIAQRILEKKGMVCEHAENGAIALRMFTQSQQNYYDVVLMDIRMPEMDGLEATRLIRLLPRQDAVKVPIIAMTANAYVEDVKAALDAGMNAHLAKPIEPEVLYRELKNFL